MATAATIKKNIAKLEAALKSKATPKSLKSKLETQLVKSKAELSGLNKGTKPKTSSAKSAQSALKSLKELVNKNKKYKNYKGAGVDLERDADRPAKPIGRRTAKASGKTYYEYRANRIDVKQPPKRYPKLEKGGMSEKPIAAVMDKYGNIKSEKKLQQDLEYLKEAYENKLVTKAEYDKSYDEIKEQLKFLQKKEKGGYYAKGGSLSSIKEEYDENEDNNAHSENVVLLAKHFGTKEDLVEAKRILDLHEKEGHLTSENGKKRQELHLKLIEKARTAMDKEGIEFAKGGATKNMKTNRDLVIEEISSMTGLRKEGIEIFANDYELTDSDLSNIMQGIGRKMISKDDFSTAVIGNKNNSYAIEIVDFAKSGKGYKIEKGGYFAKGGLTEHGLKIGDTIISKGIYTITVSNKETGLATVDLNKGERKEMKAMGGEMHRTQE
jgi:hypothetical protein